MIIASRGCNRTHASRLQPHACIQAATVCIQALQHGEVRRARSPGRYQQPTALSSILVQGGSLRTWSYRHPDIEQVRHALQPHATEAATARTQAARAARA